MGPFENDAAMDFVCDLEDAPAEKRWESVYFCLTAVTRANTYLKSGEEAFAGAALTAAAVSSAYKAPSTAAALSGLGAPPAKVVIAARTGVMRLCEPSDNALFKRWKAAGFEADLLSLLNAVDKAFAQTPV